MAEDRRFHISVHGDGELTYVELFIPTKWAWILGAVVLTIMAPNIWTAIQSVAQTWPLK
jgi:hypothetical protein